MKRHHLAHTAGDQAAPDAAGATWKTRPAPMRQGPLELLRLSSETSERAGRRPALTFLSSRGANELPKLSNDSFCCPGLTASFPAAQEWRKRRGNSPLRRAA